MTIANKMLQMMICDLSTIQISSAKLRLRSIPGEIVKAELLRLLLLDIARRAEIRDIGTSMGNR